MHNRCLSSLQEITKKYRELTSLIEQGNLPDAVQASEVLDGALKGLPVPLDRSEVVLELKVH